MTIGLHNVTPAPIAGVIASNTDIWQKECVFRKGEVYRVTAPSGKGKSTFIHCLYGIRSDYTGQVLINGTDSKRISADEWAEMRQQKISIVFQDLRLFPHLTARQNIDVKRALTPEESNDVDRMAGALDVVHLLDKLSGTLSYGERQRVAIIRALVQPFDFLLLDEPFSHLDESNGIRAARLIREEASRRKAAVVLTSLDGDPFFQYDKDLRL